MDEEHVVVSNTGGRKGAKIARFDLIPTGPLRRLAEHFGRGATKYADRNWEKGYPWSLSYAALQRHLNAFWGGEDWDPEFPDSHHLDAAMFHVMALREFFEKHPNHDDRPTKPIPSMSDQAVERIRREAEAFRKEKADKSRAFKTAFSEQPEGIGRVSQVQTGRWEIP